jgi:hypothetical protein
MNISFPHLPVLILVAISASTSGCAGAIIETTTDAALAVAKTPFKVGGAVIDVLNGEDD